MIQDRAIVTMERQQELVCIYQIFFLIFSDFIFNDTKRRAASLVS